MILVWDLIYDSNSKCVFRTFCVSSGFIQSLGAFMLMDNCQGGCSTLHSISKTQEPRLPTSQPACIVVHIFSSSHHNSCPVASHCALSFHFLSDRRQWAPSQIFLGCLHILFGGGPLCTFKLSCLSYLNYDSFSYILNVNPLLAAFLANIFPGSLSCPFADVPMVHDLSKLWWFPFYLNSKKSMHCSHHR